MGKTCSLELKIEFNDFTVSLRGGWLYYILIKLSYVHVFVVHVVEHLTVGSLISN